MADGRKIAETLIAYNAIRREAKQRAENAANDGVEINSDHGRDHDRPINTDYGQRMNVDGAYNPKEATVSKSFMATFGATCAAYFFG